MLRNISHGTPPLDGILRLWDPHRWDFRDWHPHRWWFQSWHSHSACGGVKIKNFLDHPYFEKYSRDFDFIAFLNWSHRDASLGTHFLLLAIFSERLRRSKENWFFPWSSWYPSSIDKIFEFDTPLDDNFRVRYSAISWSTSVGVPMRDVSGAFAWLYIISYSYFFILAEVDTSFKESHQLKTNLPRIFAKPQGVYFCEKCRIGRIILVFFRFIFKLSTYRIRTCNPLFTKETCTQTTQSR